MLMQDDARQSVQRACEAFINRISPTDSAATGASPDVLLQHPLINDILLNGLSLRMVIVDLSDGRYVYASPTLTDIYHEDRWEEELAQGWRYIDPLVHPADLPVLEHAVAQYGDILLPLPAAEQCLCKLVVTFRIRTTSGVYRKLLQQIIPFALSPADAKVRYLALVVQDITLIKPTDDVTAYLVRRGPNGKDQVSPLRLEPQPLHLPQPAAVTSLSAREREVLRLLVQGHSSKMIASTLGISAYTVSVHRRNLMRKTLSANAAQLSAFALQTGLL